MAGSELLNFLSATYSVAYPWHFGMDPYPHLWLTDPDPIPDPDPDIFVNDLQDGN